MYIYVLDPSRMIMRMFMVMMMMMMMKMMCVRNLEDHIVKFRLGSGAIARGHPRYFPQGGMETIANSRQHINRRQTVGVIEDLVYIDFGHWPWRLGLCCDIAFKV